ncbi:t-SNARE VTI1 [Maublancomyces gigas]|uniref:t-SNARE VTI1 n=1 Tax=Discina gigas TaxID=1032678 RepID=A0ABR3GQL3_9PEZI
MSTHPLDSDPGTELFASYEADFKLAQADISQKLDQIPELHGEPRKAAIRAGERAVDEADEIIGQMSLELSNIPSSGRNKIKPRLRNYTHDLDVSRHALLKFAQNAERDALFGARGGSGGPGDAVVDQRQQLLSGTDRLERSSQRLRDSQRIANETEGIGAGILGDLRVQREQISNTHNTLNDSERYLDRSIKTLRGMARRMATNRMITIAIITVLVLLIMAVIASKFR